MHMNLRNFFHYLCKVYLIYVIYIFAYNFFIPRVSRWEDRERFYSRLLSVLTILLERAELVTTQDCQG